MPMLKYYPVVFGEKSTAVRAFSKTAVQVTTIAVIIGVVAAATVVVLIRRRARMGRVRDPQTVRWW